MPYRPGVPSLLTVYDLIPLRYPAYSSARARFFIRWMTRLALRGGAPCYRDLGVHPPRLHGGIRPSPGADHRHTLGGGPGLPAAAAEAVADVRARYDLPERFVLYLGSNKPHKNLMRLVEAWRMANGKWQDGRIANW